MEISKRQISIFTEDESTSLPEGFRANLTPQQGRDLVKKMIDTSGQKCLEQLKRFNLVSSWAKMFLESLVGMEDWYSTRCKLTWKLKGTTYNRYYFQLAVSTLPTDEIGSGLLLKTPTKMDGQVTSGKKNPKSGGSGTLAQEIMSQYPPTIMKLGLLPTPTANEDAAGTINGNMQQMLTHSAKRLDMEGTSRGGQLSHRFALEMMGFPTDWTELPFLNSEDSQ